MRFLKAFGIFMLICSINLSAFAVNTPTIPITFAKGSYCASYHGNFKTGLTKFELYAKKGQFIKIDVHGTETSTREGDFIKVKYRPNDKIKLYGIMDEEYYEGRSIAFTERFTDDGYDYMHIRETGKQTVVIERKTEYPVEATVDFCIDKPMSP